MLEVIIPAVIAAGTSVIAVCFTQYKTKKLAFFQTYFNKKLDAYSAFWQMLDTYEAHRTIDTWVQFKSQIHAVSLFAPDDIYQKILEVASHLVTDGAVSSDELFILLTLMRTDLEKCKRMKF